MAFNFGQNNSSNSSSAPTPSLFGTASSGAASNPFGGAMNNPSSGSGTPGASTLFGGATSSSGSSNLFGTSNTPAGNKPSLFGGNQTTAGASQPGSTGFAFGNSGASGGAAKPSLFGAVGTTTSSGASTGGTTATSTPTFAFGKPAESSTPSATPAANRTSFLSSTTPAGPPPGNNLFGAQSSQPGQIGTGPGGSASSIFGGGAKPATSSGSALFGGAASAGAQQPPNAAGSTNIFGQGNKDASNNASQSTSAQLGAFGSAGSGPQATPKSSLFSLGSTMPASTPASKPTFGFGTTAASGQPASSQPTTNSTPNPVIGGDKSTAPTMSSAANNGQPSPSGSSNPGAMSLFTPGGNATSSAPPASGAANPTAGTGNSQPTTGFSLFTKSGAGSTPASSGAAAPPSFSGLGGSTPASSGAAPAGSSAPTAGLSFSGLGVGSTPASSGAASSGVSSSTTGSSLFANIGGGNTSASGAATSRTTSTSAATAPSTTTTTATAPATAAGTTTGTTTGTSGDAARSGFASSTAGPAPSAQSRLKNKSMDEIITRWAADLSKYQKEFQQQADTVAKWDRALVDNTDKVKQLYSKAFQAERDTQEVEKHLTMIEDNQSELDAYLDRYEKEIDNMMKLHGVSGKSDGLRGPDQERERTYKLAEKLQDRLNELNKDLTEMIEEINTTSQTLSKSGKPDDPLTKVVRVLNSQLAQLQHIDAGAAQLQGKIEKAHKESQHVGANGWNGLGSDPTEDFYRSFRGSRTDRFGGVS